MKKKLLALVITVITIASTTVPALAATPVIEETEYEGSGYVEVDFKRNVQYKNAKVYVKDSSGKSYKASIKKRDSDDLTFYVKSIKAGKKYTYTISGVRAGRSGSYKKVSGKFSVPAKNKVSIKSIDYDHDDRELEVEFAQKVQYKSTKVSVKDSTGKSYSVKILEKDSDSLELRVKGLKLGKRYTVKVSGVRSGGSGSYTSASRTFTAIDD